MQNLTKIIVGASLITLSGAALLSTLPSDEKILAHTTPADQYTLQHAAKDMEAIYTKLQQSTADLQDVAHSFSILVERLEEKQAQHVTANND